MAKPYRILITSNKGGTGRSTAALGLAWAMGDIGLQTQLVDLNPIPCLKFIAETPKGTCLWRNVSVEEELNLTETVEVQIIDGLPIGEPETDELLNSVNGVIINCQAEILSLSVLDKALKRLVECRGNSEEPSLLGLCLQRFNKASTLEQKLNDRLENMAPGLILAKIPEHEVLSNWPMLGGAMFNHPGIQQTLRDFANTLASRLELKTQKVITDDSKGRVRVSRSRLLKVNEALAANEPAHKSDRLSSFFDPEPQNAKPENFSTISPVALTSQVKREEVVSENPVFPKVSTSLDTITVKRDQYAGASAKSVDRVSLPDFQDPPIEVQNQEVERTGLLRKITRLFFRGPAN